MSLRPSLWDNLRIPAGATYRFINAYSLSASRLGPAREILIINDNN